jgi:hypothetical protein
MAISTRFTNRRSCWLVIALLVLAGCGSDRVPVGGVATFNGEPVLAGTITLEPADDKGVATGARIIDGKYAIADDAAPQPGKKKVRIFASRKTGRCIQAAFSPPGALADEIERYIPDIYNTRTILTCEISRDGSRQIDFNLKRQP